MSELTHLLEAAQAGDRRAASLLLPHIYNELRKLAAAKIAAESPGHTLNATALVHEAYLRLAGGQQFENRSHFFAAAGEVMRRILIDRARARATAKRGGGRQRVELDALPANQPDADLLALDDALTELEKHDEPAASLVKLRYFVGLSHQEAAESLGITRRAADRLWALARAWLFEQIRKD